MTFDINDLFFDALVRGYVGENPRFLRRDWLASVLDEKLRERGKCFVLLTAEPGAGKSVFMAQLAHDQPEWLRYFIRRDQRATLTDASARSLLFRIGYQLVARHPELFVQKGGGVSVEEHIGSVRERGIAIGAEVKRLIVSPFFDEKVLRVKQFVQENRGTVVGLRVEELVIEERLLATTDLLHLALIEPAKALLRIDPTKQIVILIDALDEIRYQPIAEDILAWLTNCPELPENIRLVLTSRPPDEALRLMCEKQALLLSQLAIAEDDPHVKADIEQFVRRLLAEETLLRELSRIEGGAEGFAQRVTNKAHGNLGYLDALARGISQALARKESQRVQALLNLKELPNDLAGLYALFLHQIKASVARERIEFKDIKTGEAYDKAAWPTVYDPVLGVLAVAVEPVTLELIERLGGILAERAWVLEALERLVQFLNVTNGRYRLYHATVAEFLTAEKTRVNTTTCDLYQDAQRRHSLIVDHYWQTYHEDWARCEDAYALNNLVAHLVALGDGPRLQELICEKWMLARCKQGRFSGNIGFIADINHAWSTALTQLDGEAKLVELFRLQTARQLLGEQTSVHSDTDLQTLVWLGRVDEALALCQLRSTPESRYFGLQAIFVSLNETGQPDSTARAQTTEEIGRWAHQVLVEAESAARVIRSDETRVKALGEVAHALDAMADLRADVLFEEATKISLDRYWFEEATMGPGEGGKVGIWALTTLAEILIKAQRFAKAEALAGIIHEDAVYEKLVEALAARDCHEAERIAHEMRDPAARAKALSAVATALVQSRVYPEAERIARSIETEEQQIKALCTLAAALAQAKDGRATVLFEELRRLVRNTEGGHQIEAMLSLSASLVQASRYAEAEEVIRGIPEVEKRVEALVLLAHAHAKAGDAQADRVFDDALEATYAIEDESWRTRSLSMVVESLVRTGSYAKAEEVGCTLLNGSARAEALCIVAAALARVGDSRAGAVIATALCAAKDSRLWPISLLNLALVLAELKNGCTNAVLDETRNAAYEIKDANQRLVVLSDMAYALARKGMDRAHASLDDALEARREAASGQEPDLERIALLLVAAGGYTQAREIIRSIPSPYKRAQALRNLGATLAGSQNSSADAVFDEALKSIKLILKPQERVEALRNLGETLTSAKDVRTKLVFGEALEAAHAIENPCERAREMCDLALAATKAEPDQAAVAIKEALGISNAIENLPVRDEHLTKVAEALVGCGYYDKGEQVAYTITDDRLRSIALGRLAVGLAEGAHPIKANRVAHAVSDCVERAKTLFNLASVLAQKSDRRAQANLDEALKITETIEVDWPRARALCDLAFYLAQTGDHRSPAVFNEAREAANAIEDPERRSSELTHLGSALQQTGDSRAEIVFKEARSAANSIEGDSSGAYELPMKGAALQELVLALSQCGRFKEAEEVTQTIENEACRTAALRTLAVALAACGQKGADSVFDEAERQLRCIQVSWIWHPAACQHVIALAGAGRYTKALCFLQSFQLDEFLNFVIEIIPNLEKSNPGISVELLREISGVAGWMRPRWRPLNDLIRTMPEK